LIAIFAAVIVRTVRRWFSRWRITARDVVT
jgi:hypothetical protein